MPNPFELHDLCKSSNIPSIQQCLAMGVDINELDDAGKTPLFYAVAADNRETVNFLLTQKADPNKAGPNTLPPLVHAAAFCQITFLALLKHPGIAVDRYERDNMTALFIAAELGFAEKVMLLLEHNADPTLFGGKNNIHSLHMAILNGHEKVVTLLITAKPELVNLPLKDQFTPLHVAAFDGQLSLIQFLLSKHALVNASSTDGVTPLYLAAQNGHDEAVKILIHAGAQCDNVGFKKTASSIPITALEKAATEGHVKSVQLLLKEPHSKATLKEALFMSTSEMIEARTQEKRDRYEIISNLVEKELNNKYPPTNVLSLADAAQFSWEKAYEYIFSESPTDQDKYPEDADSAIRHALTTMCQLLLHPEACIPYIQFISLELEAQWHKGYPEIPLPKFDPAMFEFWVQDNLVWPRPIEEYQGTKKFSMVQRVCLNKLQQYGMAEKQFKWTGFIPYPYSKALLLKNVFFTENRRTINGLFHGNVHNIQKVILLLAMEAGVIPLTYQKDGQRCQVSPKEVFSALMRNNLSLSGKRHAPLWSDILDSGPNNLLSFTYPHQLHATLLTNNAFAGTLQDFMRFSFCTKFIQLRELYNHVYGARYSNKSICNLLAKLKLNVFAGLPEFAMQMDERKALDQVKTIDNLHDEDRAWTSLVKHYEALGTPIKNYGPRLNAHNLFFKNSPENSNAEPEKSKVSQLS